MSPRTLNPEGCQKWIHASRGPIFWQCTRKPACTVKGKHYCRVHSPAAVAERQRKSDARYDAAQAFRMAPYVKIAELKTIIANQRRTIHSLEKQLKPKP